jgi:hypothetical protein
MPENPNVPAGRPDLAQHHPDGGAFARAIVPEQAVDFPGRHFQAQIINRQPRAK